MNNDDGFGKTIHTETKPELSADDWIRFEGHLGRVWDEALINFNAKNLLGVLNVSRKNKFRGKE